jgi:hypothetical protein
MRRTANLYFSLALLLGCDATIGSNDEVAGDTGTDTGSDTEGQEVPTCSSDDDCSDGQVCIGQFCSMPPVDTDCQPGQLTMDGCPSNAICLIDSDDPEGDSQACYTMPPCSADHTCPVGLYGALCNTGQVPDKDEICLISVCETIENCPANWSCVRISDNDPLGLCGGGGLGDICSKPEHCLSGMCFIPIPGLGGFCQ